MVTSDNLILAKLMEEAAAWGVLVVSLLEGLGFIVNYEKSALQPTQRIEFLGFSINSESLEIRVPNQIAGIRSLAFDPQQARSPARH